MAVHEWDRGTVGADLVAALVAALNSETESRSLREVEGQTSPIDFAQGSATLQTIQTI